MNHMADGVDTGIRNAAIAHVEGEESRVVLESVYEMEGASVRHATGSNVEVLQTLCCWLGIRTEHAPAAGCEIRVVCGLMV